MSLFSRRSYEPYESREFDYANTKPASITLDKSVNENTSACYSNLNFINAQSQMARPMKNSATLDLGEKAHVESLLMNRNLELNSPLRTNNEYAKVKLVEPTTCNDKNFTNIDSRFTNPVSNYREMYTCNYSFNPYLPINMQQVLVDNKMFLSTDRDGVSSRYFSKQSQYDSSLKQHVETSTIELYDQLIDNISLLPTPIRKIYDQPSYVGQFSEFRKDGYKNYNIVPIHNLQINDIVNSYA